MVLEASKLRLPADWLAELKTILQQGPGDIIAGVGTYPKSEHRSTKKAVKLLLSNLRTGVKNTKGKNSEQLAIDKVVFNAVDRLIADKKSESKKNKTKLEALAKFETVLNQQFASQPRRSRLDASWKDKILEAVRALRHEVHAGIVLDDKQSKSNREQAVKAMLNTDEGKSALANDYNLSVAVLKSASKPEAVAALGFVTVRMFDRFNFDEAFGDDKDEILTSALAAVVKKPAPTDGNVDQENKDDAQRFAAMIKGLEPASFATMSTGILGSDKGKRTLAAKPKLAGALFSAMNPASLNRFDFDTAFGIAKNEVLAESVAALAQKSAAAGSTVDRHTELDPALFKLLAKKVTPAVWNDQTATTDTMKGLGARVCLDLWTKGGYDQVCDLIEQGVDTSLSTRIRTGDYIREGVYSGFVQANQHVIQRYMRDVSKLGTSDAAAWKPDHKARVEGAKKVFEALDTKGTGKTLTKWTDVESSELITEFKTKPGTIWGFEDVRTPYVQAAHETDQGIQPVRMMELWEAVGESISADGYRALLDDPNGAADKFIAAAVKDIKSKIAFNDPKFADISRDKDAFLTRFQADAKNFLLEFAAQMPKGTFGRSGLDDDGSESADPLSDVAGVVRGKFLGGIACKAGLWWAKQEKKPVYYCLDGVDMANVTDYKKVKNKAIEDFINGDGNGHNEVITLMEIREILKNWKELKDTVRFVLKGRILKGDELNDKIKAWQKAMRKANRKAGRTPAPNFKEFTNNLNKIDGALLSKLARQAEDDSAKANMDARDIVKKYGYFVRIANTRPHIALKYVMSKCSVLIEYDLISSGLPTAASNLKKAIDRKSAKKIKTAVKTLRSEIQKCHKDFRTPLKTALLRHPDTGKRLRS